MEPNMAIGLISILTGKPFNPLSAELICKKQRNQRVIFNL